MLYQLRKQTPLPTTATDYYFRSTMTQNPLTNLTILSNENDIFLETEFEEIVNNFV